MAYCVIRIAQEKCPQEKRWGWGTGGTSLSFVNVETLAGKGGKDGSPKESNVPILPRSRRGEFFGRQAHQHDLPNQCSTWRVFPEVPLIAGVLRHFSKLHAFICQNWLVIGTCPPAHQLPNTQQPFSTLPHSGLY